MADLFGARGSDGYPRLVKRNPRDRVGTGDPSAGWRVSLTSRARTPGSPRRAGGRPPVRTALAPQTRSRPPWRRPRPRPAAPRRGRVDPPRRGRRRRRLPTAWPRAAPAPRGGRRGPTRERPRRPRRRAPRAGSPPRPAARARCRPPATGPSSSRPAPGRQGRGPGPSPARASRREPEPGAGSEHRARGGRRARGAEARARGAEARGAEERSGDRRQPGAGGAGEQRRDAEDGEHQGEAGRAERPGERDQRGADRRDRSQPGGGQAAARRRPATGRRQGRTERGSSSRSSISASRHSRSSTGLGRSSRIGLQAGVDRVGEALGEVGAVLAQRRHALADPARGLGRRAPGGGVLPGPAFVGGEPQGVDVGLGAHALPLGLLGGHVGERAHHLAGRREALRAGDAGDPEVHQLGAAPRGLLVAHDHVLGLDVAVDDAALVRVREAVAEIGRDLGHVAVAEPASARRRARVVARDELGHEDRPSIALAELVERDDRRMVEARGGLGLAQRRGRDPGRRPPSRRRGAAGARQRPGTPCPSPRRRSARSPGSGPSPARPPRPSPFAGRSGVSCRQLPPPQRSYSGRRTAISVYTVSFLDEDELQPGGSEPGSRRGGSERQRQLMVRRVVALGVGVADRHPAAARP